MGAPPMRRGSATTSGGIPPDDVAPAGAFSVIAGARAETHRLPLLTST